MRRSIEYLNVAHEASQGELDFGVKQVDVTGFVNTSKGGEEIKAPQETRDISFTESVPTIRTTDGNRYYGHGSHGKVEIPEGSDISESGWLVNGEYYPSQDMSGLLTRKDGT